MANNSSVAFTADMMSADAIAKMKGEYEPQRSNNAVLFIDLTGIEGADEEMLRLSLDTFPTPKQQNGTVELDYLNEKRKVAGRVTIDDMDIVYKDFVDRAVAKVLWNWRMQVYNPTNGKIGLARTYKKRGEIITFAPNGTGTRMWELYGIWPSNMDPGDYDMSGEENIKITLSLVIDKAIYAKPAAEGLAEGTD